MERLSSLILTLSHLCFFLTGKVKQVLFSSRLPCSVSTGLWLKITHEKHHGCSLLVSFCLFSSLNDSSSSSTDKATIRTHTHKSERSESYQREVLETLHAWALWRDTGSIMIFSIDREEENKCWYLRRWHFHPALLALEVPNKYKDAFLTAPPSEYQKYEGWGMRDEGWGEGEKKWMVYFMVEPYEFRTSPLRIFLFPGSFSFFFYWFSSHLDWYPIYLRVFTNRPTKF